MACPCNQFGGQEPGGEKEIRARAEGCGVKFSDSFLLATKADVNGDKARASFVFLKQQLPGMLGMNDIKWNFGKFLISSRGIPFKRYAPTTSPKAMEEDVVALLDEVSATPKL